MSEENLKKTQTNNPRTIVNVDLYLKNGIHIGTKYKNGPMRRFIFKSRSDKLNVMDIQSIDKRIKISIDFLLRYDPKDVIFISRKRYALPGMKLLEKTFGYKLIYDRFVPGTLTNPQSEHFTEPKMLFIADPNVDRQAIVEAKKIGIPVMALSTTSSNIRDIDFIIPYNNKGKKSIALYFWILVRELEKNAGIIKSDKEFTYSIEDFVYKLEKEDKRRTQQTTTRRPSRFSKRR
jgi:small subunit ribosomal protein S2